MNVSKVKALTFDTGGTILDWYSGFKSGFEDIARKNNLSFNVNSLSKEFRKKSLISDVVSGGIFGLGSNGYILAIIAMQNLLKK